MDNLLSEIALSNNRELLYLECGENLISELDLSSNSQLVELHCPDNYNLECLNVKNGNNLNMVEITADGPPISYVEVDDLDYSNEY